MSVPADWIEAIRTWAASEPRMEAVYLFGSRVKGAHRPDSDLDVAAVISEDQTESAFTYATCEAGRLRRKLAGELPVTLHLHFTAPDSGEQIVWPAVQEHGVEVYRATRQA